MVEFLREGIFSVPFGSNRFVTVTGGVLLVGNTIYSCGSLKYVEKNTFEISYRKLPEFQQALRHLTSNIIGDDEDEDISEVSIEMTTGDNLFIREKKIVRKTNDFEFELEFDIMSFFDFLLALSDTVVFISNPSKIQFEAMQIFLNSRKESIPERITFASTTTGKTEDEQFCLHRYLSLNIHVLNFALALKEWAHVRPERQ